MFFKRFFCCVDEEEQVEACQEVEFDTNLPTTHKVSVTIFGNRAACFFQCFFCLEQYLGKLENVSGYTLYDDGQILENMLALYTNTMVFPGFTLPLVLKFSFHTESMIEEIRKGYKFVLVNAKR